MSSIDWDDLATAIMQVINAVKVDPAVEVTAATMVLALVSHEAGITIEQACANLRQCREECAVAARNVDEKTVRA